MIKSFKDMMGGILKQFAKEQELKIDIGFLKMKTSCSLAVNATKQLLEKEQLDISEIGAIICSAEPPINDTLTSMSGAQ